MQAGCKAFLRNAEFLSCEVVGARQMAVETQDERALRLFLGEVSFAHGARAVLLASQKSEARGEWRSEQSERA